MLYRHVFRNALAPLITLIGLSLPGILSGALITETVLTYPAATAASGRRLRTVS